MSKVEAKSAKYAVKNFAFLPDGDEAEMKLYGIVGDYWDGITATDFSETFAKLKSEGKKKLKIRINSPGGEVLENGLAIYNAIKYEDEIEITTINDGICASMGAVILAAGKKRKGYTSSLAMVHNVWGGAWGDKNDLQKAADFYAKIDELIAEGLAEDTGKSKKELLKMMDAETWLTGEEQLEIGLLTEIIDKPEEPPQSFMYNQNQKNMSIKKSLAEIFGFAGQKIQVEEAEAKVIAQKLEEAEAKAAEKEAEILNALKTVANMQAKIEALEAKAEKVANLEAQLKAISDANGQLVSVLETVADDTAPTVVIGEKRKTDANSWYDNDPGIAYFKEKGLIK